MTAWCFTAYWLKTCGLFSFCGGPNASEFLGSASTFAPNCKLLQYYYALEIGAVARCDFSAKIATLLFRFEVGE